MFFFNLNKAPFFRCQLIFIINYWHSDSRGKEERCFSRSSLLLRKKKTIVFYHALVLFYLQELYIDRGRLIRQEGSYILKIPCLLWWENDNDTNKKSLLKGSESSKRRRMRLSSHSLHWLRTHPNHQKQSIID